MSSDKKASPHDRGGVHRPPVPVLCEICAHESADALDDRCEASRNEQERGRAFECLEFTPKEKTDDPPLKSEKAGS